MFTTFSKGALNSTTKCLVVFVFYSTITVMATDKADRINSIDWLRLERKRAPIGRTLMLFRYWFSDQFFMSLVFDDLASLDLFYLDVIDC